MTSERFHNICRDKVEKCLRVLVAKREEYWREDNRLANFSWCASFLGASAPFACLAVASKHFASIVLDVKRMGKGEKVDIKNLRRKKITDAINYLLLLEGILVEEEER